MSTSCEIIPTLADGTESSLYKELLARFPRRIATLAYQAKDDPSFAEAQPETKSDPAGAEMTADELLSNPWIREVLSTESPLMQAHFDMRRQIAARIERVRSSKASNKQEAEEKLRDLQKRMKGVSLGESVAIYATHAAATVASSHAKLLSMGARASLKQNAAFRDVAKGYQGILSLLEGELNRMESDALLLQESGMDAKLLPSLAKSVREASRQVAGILTTTAQQRDEGVAKWLYPMKGGSPLTMDSLRRMLRFTTGDVNIATRWFSAIANSADPVVALLAKRINTAKATAALRYKSFVRELIEENRLFEEARIAAGASASDPASLYAPLLNWKGDLAHPAGERYETQKKALDAALLDEDGEMMVYRENTITEIDGVLRINPLSKEDIEWNEMVKSKRSARRAFLQAEEFDMKDKVLLDGEVHRHTDAFKALRAQFEQFAPDENGKWRWVKRAEVEQAAYDKYLEENYTREREIVTWDSFRNITRREKMRFPKAKHVELHDERYMDAAYLELHKPGNEAYRRYWEFVTTRYAAMQQELPENLRPGSMPPQVLKGVMEGFLSGGITWETVRKGVSDTFAYKEGRDYYGRLDESGQLVNELPVLFTRRLEESERSLDLGSTLSAFARMAYEYGSLSEIIEEVEATSEILSEREVSPVDNMGGRILSYVGGKGKDVLRGQSSMRGSETNLYNQVKDFLASEVYGIQTEKESFLGVKDKHIDAFLKFNFVRSLSLNIFSAGSNLANSAATQWIEAAGRMFFTPAHMARATAQYAAEGAGISDWGKRIPTGKLALWNAFFDVGQQDSAFQQRSSVLRLLDADALMALDNAGEHYNKTRVGLAVAMGFEVKKDGVPLKDAEGRPLALFDVLEITPGLGFKKKVEFDFTEADRVELVLKMRRANQVIAGTTHRGHAVAAKRRALGRAVMAYRNWIEPGVRRRFEFRRDGQGRMAPIYDYEADTERMGAYISFYRYVTGGLLPDLKKLAAFTSSGTAWERLSPMEKGNIWRTVLDAGYMASAYALSSLLYSLVDYDDEEPANKVLAFAAYQARRLYTELGFFSFGIFTGDGMKLLTSPAAAINSVQNIFELAGMGIPRYAFDTGEWNLPFNDVLENGPNKGEWRGVSALEREVPILNVFGRFEEIHQIRP